MKNILGNFIVFEGTDGSGTTTQLSLLEKQLARAGLLPQGFFITYEPTDKPVGALIRSALKKDIVLKPETLARLFAADRGEHLYGPGGIAERCTQGELAVCDRYILSSLVYQGLECGDELPYSLNSSFPVPELLVYFDIDIELSQRRLQNRAVREIYENREFQRRVRNKYLSLLDKCRRDGSRVEVIDASQSPENVAAEVWRAVLKMPIFNTEN
jgi:dTMP kinase